MNSYAFDFFARRRVCGLDIAWFHVQEFPIPVCTALRLRPAIKLIAALTLTHPALSAARILLHASNHVMPEDLLALAPAERIRLRSILDAVVAALYNLSLSDMCIILDACDYPRDFSPKGDVDEVRLSKAFWRVDSSSDPELRQTILALLAFHNLHEFIESFGGDREAGVEAFLTQNNGEGWLLPEAVRLADYGLGHDQRALEHQPVASRLGPRFYDWQLAQSAEESWRECHLHARNLLGEVGYQQLLAEIEADRSGQTVAAPPPSVADMPVSDDQQLKLFS